MKPTIFTLSLLITLWAGQGLEAQTTEPFMPSLNQMYITKIAYGICSVDGGMKDNSIRISEQAIPNGALPLGWDFAGEGYFGDKAGIYIDVGGIAGLFPFSRKWIPNPFFSAGLGLGYYQKSYETAMNQTAIGIQGGPGVRFAIGGGAALDYQLRVRHNLTSDWTNSVQQELSFSSYIENRNGEYHYDYGWSLWTFALGVTGIVIIWVTTLLLL